MNNNVQNFVHKVNLNTNANTIIEVSMTVVFVAIIIFSCLVLFGS